MTRKLLIITQAVDEGDSGLGFFVRWIAEFAQHCDHVTVVCLRKGAFTSPSNVSVIALQDPLHRSRLRTVCRLYRAVWHTRHDYDAVLVHMNPEYLVLVGPLWRLWRKKVGLWYTSKYVNWWLRIGTYIATHIFTASRESFRISSKKVLITGHGIDIARFVLPHTPAGGCIRCVTVGRLSRSKGVGVLIDAYTLLKKQGEIISLVCYGGPITEADREYSEELIQKLEMLGESASILGGPLMYTMVPAALATGEYFLHASNSYALDKAVLEAIAAGLIPLTSSPAYRDLFGPYAPMLEYTEGDPVSLAHKLRALCALQNEEREVLRDSLYQRVTHEHALATLIPRIVSTLL